MKTEHPITPPPELVCQWASASPLQRSDEYWAYELYIAHHAARWGADQELEACCVIAERSPVCGTKHQRRTLAELIRERRRPKPLSLKKVAYDALDTYIYGNPDPKDKERTYNAIRRALEALPDV